MKSINLYQWLGMAIILIVPPSLSAKELTIAFPQTMPPWSIQSQDQGITLEVVREALQIAGHRLKPKYLSLKDLNQAIAPNLDGHAQVEAKNLAGHYSDKIMIFQTRQASLQSNSLQIKTMDDLKDIRIVAFQNASLLFGEEFKSATQANPRYSEIANQEEQVAMLYDGKTDLILVDKNIFLYYRRITSLVDTSPPYVFHFIPGLTEASPAFVVFHQQSLRDDFNEGLKKLKENKKYYRIFAKYVR